MSKTIVDPSLLYFLENLTVDIRYNPLLQGTDKVHINFILEDATAKQLLEEAGYTDQTIASLVRDLIADQLRGRIVKMIFGYNTDGKQVLINPTKVSDVTGEIYEEEYYASWCVVRLEDGAIHRFRHSEAKKIFNALKDIRVA